MKTKESPQSQALDELLRCPRCKHRLTWSPHALTCADCDTTYDIQHGSLPLYDLYIDDNPKEPGRDPTQVWDRNIFERRYEFIGYHENGVEFEKRIGWPEELSHFHFDRVKKRMLEWIQPKAGHRVLDVGCGAGYFLYLIREKYQAQGVTPMVTGVDISTAQLSYMVRKMSKEGIGDAVVVHGNGEYLPFEDHSFDLVTCSEVLEHIRNPLRALSEMHRVLKPGGTLLLSTPSMAAEKGWTLVLAPFVALAKIFRRPTENPAISKSRYDVPWYSSELRAVIRSARFQIDKFEHTGVIPHVYYFGFLPKSLIKPVVAGFDVVDRYLRFLLKPLAWHFVVRASKATGAE